MDDSAIKVENVSKVFKLPHEKNSTIKSAVVNFWRRDRGYEKQHALKDINFEVKKGEFFGIVGRNGSGKSTLLKLLAGIYSPTNGAVHLNGKLTPFIELGVGFNPELTGRENVYLNGALLGFSRKEMKAMYEDIVEFAELGKFMDQKLKNYSSGMQVRLAFSIAIRAHSDILLIDEVLAVGDAAFQAKSFEVFRSLKQAGKTIVFVSHDLSSVKDFCTRAIVLDKGELFYSGSATESVNRYLSKLATDEQEGSSPFPLSQLAHRITNKAEINNPKIKESKENFTVKYDVLFNEESINPNPGVIILNAQGLQISSANASWLDLKTGNFKKGDKITVEFKFPNFLEKGRYRVIANVLHNDGNLIYCWENDLINFDSEKKPRTGSIVNFPYELSIDKGHNVKN